MSLMTCVVTILLFEVSIDFDSIFEEKNRDLDFNVDFFMTNVYKFFITAQQHSTISA